MFVRLRLGIIIPFSTENSGEIYDFQEKSWKLPQVNLCEPVKWTYFLNYGSNYFCLSVYVFPLNKMQMFTGIG